jgi:hypothetical protein
MLFLKGMTDALAPFKLSGLKIVDYTEWAFVGQTL